MFFCYKKEMRMLESRSRSYQQRLRLLKLAISSWSAAHFADEQSLGALKHG